MKIPFGPSVPNSHEQGLLTSLGFDMTTLVHQGRYYYLELPTTLEMTQNTPPKSHTNETSHTTIFFKKMPVITISQKSTLFNSVCYFKIHENTVRKALNNQTSKTSNQELIVETLNKLRNEASRVMRSHSTIQTILTELKQLQETNTDEHDEIVYSQSEFRDLYLAFPAWTYPKKLQQKHRLEDKMVAEETSSFLNGIGAKQTSCNIM